MLDAGRDVVRLLLVAVVDEEGAAKGIRRIARSGISADYVIFGEPSGVGNVIVGYKGSLHLKVTCQTQTGHSIASWLFENAIERALQVWKVIADTHFEDEDSGSRFYCSTSCLTAIEGGNELSKVPSKCGFRADTRILIFLILSHYHMEQTSRTSHVLRASRR